MLFQKVTSMTLSTNDFDYHLPKELIAHHPCEKRTDSRLLCLDKNTDQLQHKHFYNFIEFLKPNDLLVFNNSKVIPARIFGEKKSGGKIEVLVERILDEHHALAHIRASKTPKAGTEIYLGEDLKIHAEVIERQDDLFKIHCHNPEPLLSLLEQHGHMPLPPYIEREDELEDKTRYQTVYAKPKGSVAAPTAGLHFDEALLEKIQQKNIASAFVTLHVGAGTFQPVRVDDVLQHKMHSEWIEVNQEVCDAISKCKQQKGRVIAIGTTTVRSLETANHKPYLGETDIFIYPGYQFNTIDAMITNFHLPKSTLLMLVSAFAGKDNIFNAYKEAIEKEYRFFSYGDAMFIS